MQNRPSNTLWSEFGAWIKELREGQRLSQAGAAHRAGIDRQQWYRIESGKSGTRRDTVIAMANAVSADVGEALKRAGFSLADPDKPQNIQEFIEALDRLGVPGLEFIGGYHGDTTPDDFEALLNDIRLVVDISLRRKRN